MLFEFSCTMMKVIHNQRERRGFRSRRCEDVARRKVEKIGLEMERRQEVNRN